MALDGKEKRLGGGGGGGDEDGDLPRTVAPLPFVTEHNISLAGRANNGEKRETGLRRSTSAFP